MKNPRKKSPALLTPLGTPASLWFSYWPDDEPAIHTLKLTNLEVHPYGLRFISHRPLEFGKRVQIRLLLPPMAAIAAQGIVMGQDVLSFPKPGVRISIRFTTLRETYRRRLADFTLGRQSIRLRAHCTPTQGTTKLPSSPL